jgi:HEAT repeat protein
MSIFAPNVRKLREKRDFEGLVKVLSDASSPARLQAICALGDLAREFPVAKHLERALEDSWHPCRLAAAIALANLGNSRGIGYLQGLVEDPSPLNTNRGAAALVLDALGDARARDVVRGLSHFEWSRALTPLTLIGHPLAFAPFLNALRRSQDPALRATCAKVLGNCLNLSNLSPELRKEIEEALGEYS